MFQWLDQSQSLHTCWLLVVVHVLPSDAILWPVGLLLDHWLIWALIHGSRVKVAPPAGTVAADTLIHALQTGFPNYALLLATLPTADLFPVHTLLCHHCVKSCLTNVGALDYGSGINVPPPSCRSIHTLGGMHTPT
jgi:hypothetical protein